MTRHRPRYESLDPTNPKDALRLEAINNFRERKRIHKLELEPLIELNRIEMNKTREQLQAEINFNALTEKEQQRILNQINALKEADNNPEQSKEEYELSENSKK